MLTKTCGKCKQELSVEFFSRKGSGYQHECKLCRTEWFKVHYRNNKQYYLDVNKLNRSKTTTWLNEYKKELRCERCGYKENTNILHFHHTDGSTKEYNVSELARRCSIKKLKQEIEKCKVLCPNCHMNLHDLENRTQPKETT